MKKILILVTTGALLAAVIFITVTREPPYAPETESEELAHEQAPGIVALIKEDAAGDITLESIEWVALKADMYLGLPEDDAPRDSAYAEAVMYFLVYTNEDATFYAIGSYFYDGEADPEHDIVFFENEQDYAEAVTEFRADLDKLEAEMHQERARIESIYEENRELIESLGFEVQLLYDANEGEFPEEQLPIYLEEAS